MAVLVGSVMHNMDLFEAPSLWLVAGADILYTLSRILKLILRTIQWKRSTSFFSPIICTSHELEIIVLCTPLLLLRNCRGLGRQVTLTVVLPSGTHHAQHQMMPCNYTRAVEPATPLLNCCVVFVVSPNGSFTRAGLLLPGQIERYSTGSRWSVRQLEQDTDGQHR